MQIDIVIAHTVEILGDGPSEPVSLGSVGITGKQAVQVFSVRRNMRAFFGLKSTVIGHGDDDHTAVNLLRLQFL